MREKVEVLAEVDDKRLEKFPGLKEERGSSGAFVALLHKSRQSLEQGAGLMFQENMGTYIQ